VYTTPSLQTMMEVDGTRQRKRSRKSWWDGVRKRKKSLVFLFWEDLTSGKVKSRTQLAKIAMRMSCLHYCHLLFNWRVISSYHRFGAPKVSMCIYKHVYISWLWLGLRSLVDEVRLFRRCNNEKASTLMTLDL